MSHEVETLTKTNLIIKYRNNLQEDWEWAQKNPETLDNFIKKFTQTINTNFNTVDIHSKTLKRTLRDLGFKGNITYKALRSLPQ